MLDTDLCHGMTSSKLSFTLTCPVWDVPLIIDVLTALLPSYQSKWDVIFGNGVRNFDSNGFGHHYDRFAYRDHFIRWNPSQGIFYEAGFNNRLGRDGFNFLSWLTYFRTYATVVGYLLHEPHRL